jgi:hypothetical protein
LSEGNAFENLVYAPASDLKGVQTRKNLCAALLQNRASTQKDIFFLKALKNKQ